MNHPATPGSPACFAGAELQQAEDQARQAPNRPRT
jgi:hypothetical protein